MWLLYATIGRDDMPSPYNHPVAQYLDKLAAYVALGELLERYNAATDFSFQIVRQEPH